MPLLHKHNYLKSSAFLFRSELPVQINSLKSIWSRMATGNDSVAVRSLSIVVMSLNLDGCASATERKCGPDCGLFYYSIGALI